ncbi:hypothetical protein [Kitasatospora cineracea]|uniref:hypothetical protein n=1 Tax=Kitasatospora cineracea TaxID=88074 RepID=UPI0037F5D990
MESTEILELIARTHHAGSHGDWPHLGGRAAFHRAGELVVNGSLGWARPAPGELVPIAAPPGSWPVHLEVVTDADPRYGMPPSWVSLAVVLLAAPEEIAEALAAGRVDDPIGDYQPLGPVGALWSDDAPLPIGWDRAFADRAAAHLADGERAGHVPNLLAVPADSGRGLKCMAFRTASPAGTAGAGAVRGPDGRLLCLFLFDAD